ncbi:hypothetical protein C8Q80DRAFT_1269721 [Daedaleopsis nitida]|nr:hypothetical protein C8Q80DRAFT_1269721 [Daedaleopsis nitida]
MGKEIIPARTADWLPSPGIQGPTLPPPPARKHKQRRVPTGKGKGKGKAKARESDSEEETLLSNVSSSDEPELSDGSGSTMDEDDVRPGIIEHHGLDEGRPHHLPAPVAGPSNIQTRHPLPRAAVKSMPELIALTAGVSIPPPQTLINEAKNQPPSWVDRDERVFAYLWTVGPMPEYRALLTSWRHVMLRQVKLDPQMPVQWGSWETNHVSCLVDVHASEDAWNKLLCWIRDERLEKLKNCTPADVQTWFLIAGMAIHNILITMEMEPDSPVIGGAEYLHNGPATIAHIDKIIEPTAAGAHHPLPAQSSTTDSPALSVDVSSPRVPDMGKPIGTMPGGADPIKPTAKPLKGKRGKPPGVPAVSSQGPSTTASNAFRMTDVSQNSADEVEDVVMADDSGTPDRDLEHRPSPGPSRVSGQARPMSLCRV